MAKPYSDEWYEEVSKNRSEEVQKGRKRWNDLIQDLFPVGVPYKCIWDKPERIVEVLNHVGKQKDTNHMFIARGGGIDLQGAEFAGETDCIAMEGGGITYILKPENLSFYAYGEPEWHYFRLEAAPLKPSGIYEHYSEQREELCELWPGEYVGRGVWDYGYYGEDENGQALPLPESARPVMRDFGGAYVIFGKFSPYNMDSSTYDGRHAKMTAEQFAEYIRHNANK